MNWLNRLKNKSEKKDNKSNSEINSFEWVPAPESTDQQVQKGGVRIVVSGAGGRMGSRIISLAQEAPDFQVAAAVEKPGHPLLNRSKNRYGYDITSDLSSVVNKCDVVIDFSSVASTLAHAPIVAAAQKAWVVGTTGFTGAERIQIIDASKRIPVILSPNMSVGANLIFGVAKEIAKAVPGFDVEIVEIHHGQKKDAPSGTAQRIAELIARVRGLDPRQVMIHGREGQVGERPSQQIGVHAVRGGDEVGDHMIYFFGHSERIELIHRVADRNAFAAGALLAAKWILGQSPGMYDMKDVLGLQ